MNDCIGVVIDLEENPSATIAEWPRALLQKMARSLGLPAIGSKKKILRYIRIAASNPRAWDREDFNLILPHLSVHQDIRRHGHVQNVLHVGLLQGMVDPAEGLEPGSNRWTWARGYLGTDAYVFVTSKLKYISRANPRLAAGNIPLFHAKPERFGSLWSAIREGEITQPDRRSSALLHPRQHAHEKDTLLTLTSESGSHFFGHS